MPSRLPFFGLVVPSLALLAYVFRASVSFSSLPHTVATRFDINGAPNGWMSRFLWLIVSITLIVAMLGIYLLLVRMQSHAQLPRTAILLFASAYGLIVGAFFEVFRIAASPAAFSFTRPLIWAAALLLAQAAVLLLPGVAPGVSSRAA